jgi:hypothetical protein
VAAKKKPGLRGGSSKVTARRKLAPGKAATKNRSARRAEPLDLSTLPGESVTQENKQVCLACVLDVRIRHLGLSVRTAHAQIKRTYLRSGNCARPCLDSLARTKAPTWKHNPVLHSAPASEQRPKRYSGEIRREL